jgi:hypothetical protein
MNQNSGLDFVKLLFIGFCIVQTGCQSSQPADTNTATNSYFDSQAFKDSKKLGDLILKDAEFSRIPETKKLTQKPYINGKIRILAKEPQVPGYRGYDLKINEERLAKTPEEVGTVVLLDFKRNKFALYEKLTVSENGKSPTVNGYFWTCEMMLIDRSIPAVIYKETFRGNKPDEMVFSNKTNADTVDGAKPDASIIYFLNSTPLK